MIKIVRGDLMEATESIVGHQVNAMGKMNSGIAKSVREKYPRVYTSYIDMVENHINIGHERKDLLGKVQGIEVADEKWIVNMFGQLGYGYDDKQYTDTSALFDCFKGIRKVAEANNLSVALPYKIGSFRGGANWDEVEDLLLTAFDGYEVTLYKLHRG